MLFLNVSIFIDVFISILAISQIGKRILILNIKIIVSYTKFEIQYFIYNDIKTVRLLNFSID